MSLEFPLTDHRKKTLIEIFTSLPKNPEDVSIEDLETNINYSRTTIFENLKLLIKIGAVNREKRAGGIYYYSAYISKKDLELKLKEKEKR
jgi:predicted transcriptional regulator